MGIVLGGISPALVGIRNHTKAFNRAAQKIADVSLGGAQVRESNQAESTAPTSMPPADWDLAGPMVDMLVAQRAHAASIQAMKVSHQMLREITELGEAVA